MDDRLVGMKGWLHDVLNMPLRVKEMVVLMADVSNLLNDVAEKLRGPVYTSVQALIAENNSLRGEDASESAAAANVQEAFGQVSDLFAQAGPDTPDVPPLELPGDGSTEPTSTDDDNF